MTPVRLILLFALLQCIVAFCTLSGNFTHEEAMWHYIGRNWFRWGLTPYEGGVDNKSPLIFAVFGVSDHLFGINFWFPRLLGISCQSAGIYFLYKIAFLITRRKLEAIVAITVYGLSLLWHGTGGKYVSFTETYAVTFLLMSVYYYLAASQNISSVHKRSAFASGLLAGVALGWRLTAVFGILAVCVHALLKRKDYLLPFLSVLVLFVAILCGTALIAGIDPTEIYLYTIADNVGSGSTTDHSFAWKTDSFLRGFVYSELLIFYPFIALFIIWRKRFALPAGMYALLIGWLLFEFAGINILGIYAYPHFKHLLPVLSLMCGIVIVHFGDHYRISMKRTLIALWIIFFPKSTEPLHAIKQMLSPAKEARTPTCGPSFLRPDELEEKLLGLWIKDNTSQQGTVLVAGFGARVQLYSERRSPTIFFNVTQTVRAIDRLEKDISRNPPDMIIVPRFADYKTHVQENIRTMIDTMTTRQYRKIQDCLYSYGIYRRIAP